MPNKTPLPLRPLSDRVVVLPLDEELKTPTGLFLPESAKDKPQQGLVVATGPGRWDEKGERRVDMGVSENDQVVFVRYAGIEIKLSDKKYLILGEKDILAVLEKSTNLEPL